LGTPEIIAIRPLPKFGKGLSFFVGMQICTDCKQMAPAVAGKARWWDNIIIKTTAKISSKASKKIL
jgi:hypothetical protein